VTITREQSKREIAALQDAIYKGELSADVQIPAVRAALAHPCAAHEFDLAGLHEDLATSLRSIDHYDEAIEEMELAIAAGYRSWPVPEVEIAELHLLAGRRETAASLFDDIRERTPHDVWLYNAVGYIYAEVADHESALRWFTDGIELAMGNARLSPLRGRIFAGQPHDLVLLSVEVAVSNRSKSR
jgi:tetratricopeptide (TPR) repeat protein